MKTIRTVDAVGHVLCHDMTQIIPGVSKDAIFRKGHIVTKEDIPVLLSMGKENLYVWQKNDDMLHIILKGPVQKGADTYNSRNDGALPDPYFFFVCFFCLLGYWRCNCR